MMVEMTDVQLERLIVAVRGGGRGGAARSAVVVGPMGPCGLGKDKLKRPKRWSDWRKDAENKMRFPQDRGGRAEAEFLKELRRCGADRVLGEGGEGQV